MTKTIAGPAARLHGRTDILVDCEGPLHNYSFLTPAHTQSGWVSRYFSGIPAGSRCTVTETVDGHTAAVCVAAIHAHQSVTVPADGTVTAHITDVFTNTPAVTG